MVIPQSDEFSILMNKRPNLQQCADPQTECIACPIRKMALFRGVPEEDLLRVEVTDDCDACGLCTTEFQCPAMSLPDSSGKALIDRRLCVDCGVCARFCPQNAIVPSNMAHGRPS